MLKYWVIISKIIKVLSELSQIFCDAGTKYLNILVQLNGDTRVSIYTGITGLLIAIVIFITEIISDKKIEIYKALMLKKNKIVKNIAVMMVTLLFIWISEIVSKDSSKIFYIIFQTLVNIAIIYSTIETFKMFLEAVKLNTQKDYFDDCITKYVYNELDKNAKEKEKRKKLLENKNKEFLNFIDNSKIFKYDSYPIDLIDKYTIFESNKSGYIIDFDYYVLNKIENSLLSQIQLMKKSKKNTDNLKTNLHEIVITKKIGEKSGNGHTIAYYKNVKDNIINMLNNAIIIDNKKVINCDNQISKIINDVFSIVMKDTFDIDVDYLVNLYDFLCLNKYESIIYSFMDKIYDFRVEYSKEIEKNEGYCQLLNRLATISLKYNRYEDFKKISIYLTGLYRDRIKIDYIDVKDVAYKYAVNIFSFLYYLVKRKEDYKFYDLIMSNLLLLIKDLLIRNRVDAILVIFDNIYFDMEHITNEEFTEIDIVNFQFIIAIIYFILYKYKNLEKENNEEKEQFVFDIVKLIDILKYKFFEIYNIIDAIFKFYKYSEKKSEIKDLIETADSSFESHRYKSVWSCSSLDSSYVLKCFIYMFDITYYSFQNDDKEKIKREDLEKYERLLKIANGKNFDMLEEQFKYEEKIKPNLLNALNEVIEIADAKEKEYELNAIINTEKIKSFKDIIIKNSSNKSELEKLLWELGKVKNLNNISDKTYGINTLIPRNWFIVNESNYIYTDHVAEDFGNVFKKGIKNEIVKYIKKIAVDKQEKIEDFIKRESNIDNYILLTSRANLHDFAYKYDNGFITIMDKKVKTIFLFEISDFIIINKNSLPILEINQLSITNNQEKNYYDDNRLYIDIKDCSNNEELRKSIMDECDWLKEKGDEIEQDNFLKTMCDFKVFKSFSINESDNKECYVIKKSE